MKFFCRFFIYGVLVVTRVWRIMKIKEVRQIYCSHVNIRKRGEIMIYLGFAPDWLENNMFAVIG